MVVIKGVIGMLNIDEAIEILKNGGYLTNREEEQIAAWLEELKMLRFDSCTIHMPERLRLVENGYNKAIDDFVKLVKEHEFKYGKEDITNCVIGFIEFFAEQLKEGVAE